MDTFLSVEQRILSGYWGMLAPFHPVSGVSEEAQWEFYQAVKGFLEGAIAEPGRTFSSLHEDDAFPNRFNCASYGKPKLRPTMKAIEKKVSGLFLLLQQVGRGTVAMGDLPPAKQRLLSQFGLTEGNEAWHVLATQWPEGSVGFMRCWFDPGYPYMERTMAKLYERAPFERLVSWLTEHGYTRYEGVTSPNALDYVKCTEKEEHALGNPFHGDNLHYGVTFEFRVETQVPQFFVPRLIRFTELLGHVEPLHEKTQQMILSHTKRCDACRYCVQTDKTGTRSLAAIPVGDERLCPYFPGFRFARSELTMDEAEGIIALLSDVERMCARPR